MSKHLKRAGGGVGYRWRCNKDLSQPYGGALELSWPAVSRRHIDLFLPSSPNTVPPRKSAAYPVNLGLRKLFMSLPQVGSERPPAAGREQHSDSRSELQSRCSQRAGVERGPSTVSAPRCTLCTGHIHLSLHPQKHWLPADSLWVCQAPCDWSCCNPREGDVALAWREFNVYWVLKRGTPGAASRRARAANADPQRPGGYREGKKAVSATERRPQRFGRPLRGSQCLSAQGEMNFHCGRGQTWPPFRFPLLQGLLLVPFLLTHPSTAPVVLQSATRQNVHVPGSWASSDRCALSAPCHAFHGISRPPTWMPESCTGLCAVEINREAPGLQGIRVRFHGDNVTVICNCHLVSRQKTGR
ncbi:uncharacterized protein LOC119865589 [Canis lupus familiaris]|uniref:uncharacterized protein LOC119865589 n=1 Tax=Canis lupus familiaris TaxID=9615 RepID=UPI0018F7D32F|nr:uncharacterized protein LOC119865589 [Canis lupus familiaris]